LLIVVGAAAYFTAPTRDAHEQAAREFLQGYQPSESAGINLDSIIAYVQGMMAGQGRFENFYLLSKYTLDIPGASFVECYGMFTLVRCSAVEPGASS